MATRKVEVTKRTTLKNTRASKAEKDVIKAGKEVATERKAVDRAEKTGRVTGETVEDVLLREARQGDRPARGARSEEDRGGQVAAGGTATPAPRARETFETGNPDDPEEGRQVADMEISPDPEPRRTHTGTPEEPLRGRSRKTSGARQAQESALRSGNANAYWESVLGKPAEPAPAAAERGRGRPKKATSEEGGAAGAFTDLGVTNDSGQDVGGFCTGCDKPIPGPEAAIRVTERKFIPVFNGAGKPPRMVPAPLNGGEVKFAQSRTAERGSIGGALMRPKDSTLCDTCEPIAKTITPEGQASYRDQTNVQRPARS